MKVAKRDYSVGFELVEIGIDFIKIKSYSIIDGIKTLDNYAMTLIPGDRMEYSYTKSIKFEDWIDVGDSKVKHEKEI